MAVPLAAPLAPALGGAVVKGVAQGIGAALRYGPALLQLADAFRRPGGLGGTVADAPRRQRLAELIADAINGARLPVAMPPSPGFPGPGPFGPLGPLMPWDAAARALVAALGQLSQGWNQPSGSPQQTLQRDWPETTGELFEADPGSPYIFTVEGLERITTGLCDGGPGTVQGGQTAPQFFEVGGITSFQVVGDFAADFSSPCGTGDEATFNSTYIRVTLPGGGAQLLQIAGPAFIGSGPSAEATFVRDYYITQVKKGPDFILPPPIVIGEGFVPGRFPLVPGAFADLPDFGPAPVPVPTVPDPPPLADPLPADPAVSDNPEALTAPVPVVPPLPAYTPRPLPGPVLPEFEPEPEAEPSRGPGTDRPTRPVIPGDRPEPSTPGPIRPFPDVPAEPGVFPDNPPGPGETPSTPPGPSETPSTPPVPTVDPGVFPQPGPPATPTGPDGRPQVPDTDTTTVTPTDQHSPVPGDDPVTGNGPAPTLRAMAREMGRQEQKLGRLLERVGNPNRPTGPGVDPPSIPDLLGLLRQVLELLGSIDGAGAYEIASPCNVNPATGEPEPPLSAEWGPSLGLERNILKRVDALAELLQHHKDLPQPICRGPRPTGDHVTVNFEQVPDDLEAPS